MEEPTCSNCGWPLFKGYPPFDLEVDGVREIVEGVPGLICRSCGEVYRDVDDVLTAKAIARLHQLGLYPNDLPAVTLMFAPSGDTQTAPIPGKTVFQKELWYLSKATESTSFPKPKFIPMQGGPWDANLDRRIDRMREKGLAKQVLRGNVGQGKIYEYSLTPEGKQRIARIWATLPEGVRHAAEQVKTELNGLTAKEVVDKVHRDYPRMWDKSKIERWGVTLEEQGKVL